MNTLQALLVAAAVLSVAHSMDFKALNQFRRMILCCQVHDDCYSQSMQHSECWPILDNPYTELYDYSCDKKNKKVSCGREYAETKGTPPLFIV
ncbi:Phospholipase A2 [Liparis tanakae]|uniref:Phospholipase A2 n=1 Tax=Liparis tanakae TaxID=230148 RepID=A0A4Z2EBX6_9TELE|nr:Phospholipase A2 [Liparis tanakae]